MGLTNRGYKTYSLPEDQAKSFVDYVTEDSKDNWQKLDGELTAIETEVGKKVNKTEYDTKVLELKNELDNKNQINGVGQSSFNFTGANGKISSIETGGIKYYIKGYLDEKQVTSTYRTELGGYAKLFISASAKVPNVDTKTKTMTFYPNFYILFNKTRKVFNTEIVVNFAETGTLQYLFFNALTQTLHFIKGTDEGKITENDMLISVFALKSNTTTINIQDYYCDFKFTIDGKLYGAVNTPYADDIKNKYANAPTICDSSLYEPCETYACDGTDDTFAFNYTTTVASDVYAKYDELMFNYPNYIKKEVLGKDSSNTLDICKYTFKPELPKITVTSDYKATPKIILIVGQHGSGSSPDDAGDNPTHVYSTFFLLRDMCKNWKQNKVLEFLRWNVELIIIPIANPWGFNNKSRYNVNSVDINRNFDYYWTNQSHGGSSAFSEVETRYIRDVIIENKDAMYCGDIHTQGGGNDPNLDERLIWHSISDKSLVYYASLYNIGNISRRWYGLYGLSDISHFGFISANSGSAMLKGWCENIAGVNSSTFELSSATVRITENGNQVVQSRNNHVIMKMMTQSLGVWVADVANYFAINSIKLNQ